jgi:hypothetical protein
MPFAFLHLGSSISFALFSRLSLFISHSLSLSLSLPLSLSGLAQYSQSLVSTNRMLEFFSAEELTPYVVREESKDGTVVSMSGVSMCWMAEEVSTEHLSPSFSLFLSLSLSLSLK